MAASYKVTDAGNYLTFTDLESGTIYKGVKSEIKVIPFEADQTQFYIYGTNIPGGYPAQLQVEAEGKDSQLFEADGTTAYNVDSWTTYTDANTGKSSAGGSASTPGWLYYDALLFQLGINDPEIISVLNEDDSDYYGDIAWVYSSAGIYVSQPLSIVENSGIGAAYSGTDGEDTYTPFLVMVNADGIRLVQPEGMNGHAKIRVNIKIRKP